MDLKSCVELWCTKQRDLLRAEEQASEVRSAQKKGLVGDIVALETGLGSKLMISIGVEKGFVSVAESYRPGDAVGVVPTITEITQVVPAVITSVGRQFIVISVDESKWDPYWESGALRISPAANRVVFARIHSVLGGGKGNRNLSTAVTGDSADVVRVVFCPEREVLTTVVNQPVTVPRMQYFSQSLNESQQNAVQRAACANHVYCIHGPPGTGKTTTLCEVLRQLILVQKKRVLVCAPSNVAVDNILDKLLNNHKDSAKGVRALRIGDLARVSPATSRFALEEQLFQSEDQQLVMDIKKEIDKALKELRGRTKYAELSALRQELRVREAQAVSRLLQSCNLVASTLNGASNYVLEKEQFDVVVIDEAGQTIPAECWIGMLRAPKVILAGDPYQLPPTVLSNLSDLEKTVFGELIRKYGDTPEYCTLLDTQYRMHDDICRWTSAEFYKKKLMSDESVASCLLSECEGVDDTFETSSPIVFMDTCSMGFTENVLSTYDLSKVNHGEANLVVEYVRKLQRAHVNLQDIGVVTPYSAQASLVRDKLRSGDDALDPEGIVEVSTVDAYQGREKLVIIVTFVRCNLEGEVGFLSEPRRINVALTRAMRHLCVIGDSRTLRQEPFLKRLCEYLDENATPGDTD